MANSITLFIIILFSLSAIYILLSSNLFKFCFNGYKYSYKSIVSKYEYEQLCENVFALKAHDNMTASFLNKFYRMLIDLEMKEMRKEKFGDWLKQQNDVSFKIKMTLLRYAVFCIYIALMYLILVSIPMFAFNIFASSIKSVGYIIFGVLVIDLVLYFFQLNIDDDIITGYLYYYYKLYSSLIEHITKALIYE